MTKKQLIFIILTVILLAFFVYFFLRGDENITNYPPKNQTVVAFGDSLIEGVGATPGNDFVSIVERNLGIEIINKGLSGDTTISALDRMGSVLAEEPGVVIMLLGGNDALRRIPKKETFENLGKIIENFQSEGAIVVLLGVRGGILFDGYDGDYEELSEKYHTAYVSNVLDNLFTNQKYMSDSIHPNDQGYAIIGERVTSVLKKLLK